MTSQAFNPIEIAREIQEFFDSLVIPYGINYLDEALQGIIPGEVTLIGARSGSGKTELATHILQTQTEEMRSVCYFATDHENGEIQKRQNFKFIAERVKADPELKNLNLRYSDWRLGKVPEAVKKIQTDFKALFKHIPNNEVTSTFYERNMPASKILNTMQNPQREYCLYILDHFHAVQLEGDVFKAQREFMRALCSIAKSQRVPLIIMGQFRKSGAKGRAPIPEMEEFSGPGDLIS